MAKLSKIYETNPDYKGFTNQLEIECEYKPATNEIENLWVTSYSGRQRIFTNLTEIFETVPELVNLVDNIDWREVYANKEEKEVYDER